MVDNYLTTPWQKQNTQTIAELSARGIDVEQKNGKYYAKIEGVEIEVEPYDTVWSLTEKLVKQKNKERANSYDEEIKKGQENVKKYYKLFHQALESVRELRQKCNSFLRNNHATCASELEENKKAEYSVLQDEKYSAIAERNRNSAEVQSWANRTISYCCSKMNYNC